MMQKGYVALITILVIGAISVTFGVTLLLSGTDAQREVISGQSSAMARKFADACAEEALQRIHDNRPFTGVGSLSFARGTCTYEVQRPGGNTRIVFASGAAERSIRRIEIHATITSNISITSWQEVE